MEGRQRTRFEEAHHLRELRVGRLRMILDVIDEKPGCVRAQLCGDVLEFMQGISRPRKDLRGLLLHALWLVEGARRRDHTVEPRDLHREPAQHLVERAVLQHQRDDVLDRIEWHR